MMNKRIRSMIDEIFSEMKMTAENLALRDELMANALSRFDDAIAQGKTEEEAFCEVAASLEDVSGLLNEMNADSASPSKEQPTEKHDPKIDIRINLTDEPFEDEEEEAETEAHENPSAPQTDLGDALNKAFSALGSWGQSIMPQAKKFARQMDDATGGMLSDLGRAVNKGMQDAQKAASEVLDRYQQEKPAQDAAVEKTPDDLREDAKDLRAQADIKLAVGDEAGATALAEQAELLEAQADALGQAIAMEAAAKAAESEAQQQPEEESPFASVLENNEEAPAAEPIYGADGELNEDAFARSVEEMSRDAEKLIRDAGEAIGSAAKQAGEIIDEAINGRYDPQNSEIRFPAVGLRRIDAKLDADDISIEPADGDEIIVRWAAQNVDGEPEVTMHNHTLSIRRKNPDVFKTFFSVFSKNGGQITVLVPRGYAADYTLSSTSGDVRLTGLDVDNVKISTSSGSVRIESDLAVRASDIEVESISGSVTVSAMAEEISAQSVSGDVFISCDAVSVKGDVVSGKLHIEGACDEWDVNAVSGRAELVCTVPPTRKISADSISGSVTLFLPGSIRGFAVEFESMSGSLTNEFGADRFGTCALPIHLNTISGRMIISRL